MLNKPQITIPFHCDRDSDHASTGRAPIEDGNVTEDNLMSTKARMALCNRMNASLAAISNPPPAEALLGEAWAGNDSKVKTT
ncbi:MAG: hypothetical protein BGN91_01595 [Nitrobacter sp. 62-13]|nr:MAG: hypothetical protein BGN91_01595 [Nitrobacter sp. 62-13]